MVGRLAWNSSLILLYLTFLFQPLRDGQRVLECLQKSLRIASSSIENIVTVQLYCDALDHYVYYYERQVKEVSLSVISVGMT